mmetsp:Transcript_25164/g.65655  ORF Transcript_25164/g.65655 Transcript_25164/m.65655 type:complete len:230 (-) Transcript_25164:1380-2069(-)
MARASSSSATISRTWPESFIITSMPSSRTDHPNTESTGMQCIGEAYRSMAARSLLETISATSTGLGRPCLATRTSQRAACSPYSFGRSPLCSFFLVDHKTTFRLDDGKSCDIRFRMPSKGTSDTYSSTTSFRSALRTRMLSFWSARLDAWHAFSALMTRVSIKSRKDPVATASADMCMVLSAGPNAVIASSRATETRYPPLSPAGRTTTKTCWKLDRNQAGSTGSDPTS